MKKIPYGRQNITQADIDAVVEALKSDYLTQGPRIASFEEAFANYIGAKYAIAVANGTAALHLSALALNVDNRSKVITTPVTFAASANCIRYCDGEVVFADIDPKNALIDLDKVENLLKSSPNGSFSGIIPVDFAGYPVNMEDIKNLAEKYNLWIIEDACHAPGGYFIDSKGEKQLCGNCAYSELAIFSFHPVKHIACGEGGMITTNDKELYERLIKLRTHGITKVPNQLLQNDGGWYYEMQELGYNYRLTDIQAALGISQLKRADEGLHRRKEIAERYDQAFGKAGVNKLSPTINGYSHAYHLYVIRVNNRKKVYDYLQQNGILCQVHYIPVHLLPYYKMLGWKEGDLPYAEAYYKECLSLPMYPSLTDEEQVFVIEKVLEVI